MIEKFYSELDGIDRGVCSGEPKILTFGEFSNGVRYKIKPNCLSYSGDYNNTGWWGEGLLVGIDGKYLPLNWLIKKEYVPEYKSIDRIYKNYRCDATIYILENLYNPNDYSWERGKDQQMTITGDYLLHGIKLFNYRDNIRKIKNDCNKFLNLGISEQIKFNEDRGYSYY